MKKINKKILIGSSLSLVAIAGLSGMAIGISTTVSNKVSSNNVVDSSLQPKFLGTNKYGINEYLFNNKPINYGGYYYENSAEAVQDYITQDTNSKNKIVTGNESYIGDITEIPFNNGDGKRVDMSNLNKTFFKNDQSVQSRLVPVYENYRLNGSGVNDNQRFTTSRQEAKYQSITNITSGQKYTDGFGNIFNSENDALNSRKKILRNRTSLGVGYYEITDKSANNRVYKINPLNASDQKLLKTIAINNLNLSDSDFTFDIFNLSNKNGNYYFDTTDNGNGSVYDSSSKKIAAKVAQKLASFISTKVANKITYKVNVNPAFYTNFKLEEEWRSGSGLTGAGWRTRSGTVNRELLHSNYDDSNDPSFSVYKNGFSLGASKDSDVYSNNRVSSFNLTANSFDILENIADTFTKREEFLKVFEIKQNKVDLYAGLNGWIGNNVKKDLFDEYAVVKNGDIFGNKDIKSIGIKLNPKEAERVMKGWVYNHGVSRWRGDTYYNSAIDFPILKSAPYVDAQNSENSGQRANSEIIFNLNITPSCSLQNSDYSKLATSFKNEIQSDPLLNDFFPSDTELETYLKTVFNDLNSYINNTLLKNKYSINKYSTTDLDIFKGVGYIDDNNNFSNSVSWISDFIINKSDFINKFNKSVIENDIYNIQQNVIDSKTKFIIKYKGAPLYLFDYDPNGIFSVDKIFGSSSLKDGMYYDKAAVASSLQRILVDPKYLVNGEHQLLKQLKNISNKVQLVQTSTSDGKLLNKYVIPSNNLDNDVKNDTNFIEFDQADTKRYKRIKIPKEYTENNQNENLNIAGNLLISEKDPVSMLNRNSGIYMIANYYNKQVDKYYQEYGNDNGDIVSTESENLLTKTDDIVVLFNTYDSSTEDEKLSDYLNVSTYREIFSPKFNISLNENNQRIFSYEDDKTKYLESSTGKENDIGKVYLFYDYSYKQLNKNIYNTEELAKQEALSNVVIRPSQEKILLLNEGVEITNPETNYVDQGKVISKNTSMLTWINLSNLADDFNGWSRTPVYFSNYTNAFNYMRYLFEMSYTVQ